MTPLGPVRAKGMFGGHGIFLDDLMLGLTLENQLWLKADDLNRSLYRDAGSRCFVYKRMGKPVELGFWCVPPEIWSDPHDLIAWAESAFAAAKRTKAKKR
ncbi:MAG: TfoX/Sxy family protein [Alphaproteobacteria bacterium]